MSSEFDRWWSVERSKPWAKNWSISRAKEHFRINSGLRNRFTQIPSVPSEETIYERGPELNEGFEEVDLTAEEVNLADLGAGASESVPLLNAVPAGVGLSAASGASAGGLPTFVIGGAAAAGLGILGGTLTGSSGSESVDKETTETSPKRPILTFPDHKFIGPGNTVDPAEAPEDLDDQIAKEHDILYEKAKTEQDILDADKHAISDFVGDVLETGNPHSAAGAAGLGIKHLVEKTIKKIIYPNLAKGKPWVKLEVDMFGDGILIIGRINV